MSDPVVGSIVFGLDGKPRYVGVGPKSSADYAGTVHPTDRSIQFGPSHVHPTLQPEKPNYIAASSVAPPSPTPTEQALASIADSLKRIADHLEGSKVEITGPTELADRMFRDELRKEIDR